MVFEHEHMNRCHKTVRIGEADHNFLNCWVTDSNYIIRSAESTK